ncbi:DTW domain-containing protein, partial [Cephalotus follicularis]
MLTHVGTRIRSSTRNNPFYSILSINLLHKQTTLNLRHPKTLKMALPPQSKPKRPTCPSCSKPASLCICTRIRIQGLENSVSVTILQHKLETNHALNSARIAKIGFKNITAATVFDVNFEARFFIRLLEPGHCSNSGHNGVKSCDSDEVLDIEGSQKPVFEDVDGVDEEPVISATIGKYGVINDFGNVWMMEKDLQSPNFDQILRCRTAVDELAKGFIVKKIQKRQLSGSMELEEYEELELTIPPGSLLLFPSDKAVGIDGLKALNFEVKNLIVLDGTWSKANRMYKENPWLKLLPHLRLDLNKRSLYSEVRQQPKAGCLSTIESIVYALQAVGDNREPEGLDNLLEVFELMVGDQRRCKNERLSK